MFNFEWLYVTTLYYTVWLLTIFDSVRIYSTLFYSVCPCCMTMNASILSVLLCLTLSFPTWLKLILLNYVWTVLTLFGFVLTLCFVWFLLFNSIQLWCDLIEYILLCFSLFNPIPHGGRFSLHSTGGTRTYLIASEGPAEHILCNII